MAMVGRALHGRTTFENIKTLQVQHYIR
jgi:5-methylcytosine-specific restriction endonuclease McrA/DNA-binding transcriptional regulator YiaG